MAGISGRQNSQRVWMNRKIPAEDGTGSIRFMVEQSIDPGELRWSLRQGEPLALVLLDIHVHIAVSCWMKMPLKISETFSVFLCNTKRM